MFPKDRTTILGSAPGSSSSSIPTEVIASGSTLFQGGIAAAVVQEGTAFAGAPADHPSDQDGVIAAGVSGVPLALDVGEGPVQQDQTFGAPVIAHAVEAILVGIGEAARERLLRTLQNVDHEDLGRADGVVQLG